MVIQRGSEEWKLVYQQECKNNLPNYTRHKKYHEENQFTLYKIGLQMIATTLAKERRSHKLNQARVKFDTQEVTDIQNINTNELSFLI